MSSTQRPEPLESWVDELARRYFPDGAYQVTLTARGLGEVYRVVAAGIAYALKVERPGWRPLDAVEGEAAAVGRLADFGPSIARAVRAADGTYVQAIETPTGVRNAMLCAWAPGRSVPIGELDELLATKYGRALAAMHAAWDGLDGDHGDRAATVAAITDVPLDRVLPRIEKMPDVCAAIETCVTNVRARLCATANELDHGIIHGEFNLRNSHYDDPSGVITAFDFEGSGPGFRAWDLAVWRFMLGGRTDLEERAALQDAFEEGYASIRPLMAVDRETAVAVVPLRILGILANIVRSYQPRPDGGFPDPTFLAGVLGWFREPQPSAP